MTDRKNNAPRPLCVYTDVEAIHNPYDKPLSELPIIYTPVLQITDNFKYWIVAVSEDGYIFGGCVSDYEHLSRVDIGFEAIKFGQDHIRLPQYVKEYPEGFRIVWLPYTCREQKHINYLEHFTEACRIASFRSVFEGQEWPRL